MKVFEESDQFIKIVFFFFQQVDYSGFSRFYDFVFFICRENRQKNISKYMV